MDGVAAHLAAAARLRLPAGYLRFGVADDRVGFVRPGVAARLSAWGLAREVEGGVAVADAAGLAAAQAALAADGVVRLRGELFDVRAAADGPVLARVDRGALPIFGIMAQGVHVNGLVRDGAGWRLWVARRSRTKLLDAGKLDHIVAGGICAGMDAAGTLVKEAEEEASVPAALAQAARAAGVLEYAIERPEGLRRDRLHCYDLELPAAFVPVPRDGEVEEFTLLRLEDVLRGVAETDDYKFNVNLVIIDLCARLGMIDPGPALQALRAV